MTAALPELAAAMNETRIYRDLLLRTQIELGNLATGLEQSAAATSPSRKSEIERACARQIRNVLDRLL